MSKTFLVGYYGMLNTGDDALLNATAWGAKRFMKADNLHINSPRPLKLYTGQARGRVLVEKQSFPAQNRLLQYKTAVDSDRVIFGGGSVLHNARDINIKRHLMKLSGGRGHLALGVGIGPFLNVRAEKACKAFLEECQFVGVRDKQSYEIAKSIAPSANVDLTFDLAPQLLQLPGAKLMHVEREGVAVCLCPRERLVGNLKAETARLKLLASALDKIYTRTQQKIYFVDFNGHAELGDKQTHHELASMLSPATHYQFVEYNADPLQVLQRMSIFKTIISMRLHAAVFGFLTNTPVISLNYHRKCNAWCEQVGIPQEYLFDAGEFDPSILAEEVCLGITSGFKGCEMTTERALELSMTNWSKSYGYQHAQNEQNSNSTEGRQNEKQILDCYSTL